MAMTGPAFAGGVRVQNDSSIDIDNLTASAPGKNAWGDDLLKGAPARSLDIGKTYVVRDLKPGTYDLKSYDDETGRDCVIRDVDITKAHGAAITKDMTKS